MVVGSTLNTITGHYLVIDGRPLRVESTRKAVASAFYSYHALYTSYPVQSQRMWVVLERSLFGIKDETDHQSSIIAKSPDIVRLITALSV